MAQRQFGPTRGAGVVIIEQEGDKSIEPGALGMAAYGGILDRGPVGELIIALTKSAFTRVCGGRTSDSLVPDAALDYYGLANGAGGLLIVRVTDGNELPASYPVYTRHLPRVQLGTIQAHNGGRWGGRELSYTNEVPVVGDINEIDIDTGITIWKTDQWIGGYIELAGVPNIRYTITGNDNTGTLSVESDSTMSADLAAGDDTANKRYYLVLENESVELAVHFGDGSENPTSEFSIAVTLDGEEVFEKENLHTDPENPRYWVEVINNDSSNSYIKAVDVYTGSHNASARPGNHYGTFTSLTTTILTATIHEFLVSSPGGGNPTVALGSTTDTHLAQVITMTMSDATNFSAVSDKFGALGSGTLGSLFTPNNKWTPPFTVTAGASPLADTNILLLTYKPFASDSLANGLLYPDKDFDRRRNYRIASNTHNTVTVASGSDMAADVAPVAAAPATGTVQDVAKADYIDGETLVLTDTTGVVYTFYYNETGTYTPGGGYDATNIEADISGASTANDVATIVVALINAAAIEATAGSPTLGLYTVTQDNNGVAGNVVITETVADVGFLVTGFTSGLDASVDQFQVQAFIPASGGRDGHADLVDSDYSTKLWDTSSSPFRQIVGKNLGLIKFATPGITATAVQKAGIAYADAKNHQYRVESPSNILTEQAVDTYLNDTIGRSNYAVTSWPSYGFVSDPDSSEGKLKLVSLTGMVHGREAQIATAFNGHHKAQAGIDATLPSLLELPTGDEVLNEEYLNPIGINVIKKVKGNFVLWGDRTLWTTSDWKWKHQREQMSYYEHVLQEGFDWIIFAINDPLTEKPALTTLNAFFMPEWVNRALRGAKFEDAAKIKIDSENNTDLTRSQGDMHAEILLRLADTVERFKIRIGKQGIFESVA